VASEISGAGEASRDVCEVGTNVMDWRGVLMVGSCRLSVEVRTSVRTRERDEQ
jgi:hypothetical protein